MNISRKARARRDAAHSEIAMVQFLAACWKFKVGCRKFTGGFAVRPVCKRAHSHQKLEVRHGNGSGTPRGCAKQSTVALRALVARTKNLDEKIEAFRQKRSRYGAMLADLVFCHKHLNPGSARV